jgi:mannan endo-1,6-alpha-mannosidase
MHFFKGTLARNLARVAQVAPFSADTITPLLQSSAQAAASVGCASSGESCSFNWRPNSQSGTSDLGSQFSALEVIQANLVPVGKSLAGSGSSASNSSATGAANGGGGPTKSEAVGKGWGNVAFLTSVMWSLLAI